MIETFFKAVRPDGTDFHSGTVRCIWCSHTETGEGYAPHDAIIAHQIESHGRRKMACGCQYVANGGGSAAWHWWTCDDHAVAHIKQITAWQIANYEACRWDREKPQQPQPSLFAGAGAS